MLMKKIIAVLISLAVFHNSEGQIIRFNGQAAGWLTGNVSTVPGFQAGVRYIPELSLNVPVNDKYSIEGELSADGAASYTMQKDSAGTAQADARLYRFWLRLSGERFEVRAGLQKINFGSASMLRPLMWFDRIDPRDPLGLTTGVYGLLGKYYFKNNANIWIWGLIGNGDPKGWEIIPSETGRPEFGGRLQLPVPRGEFAITYNNREAEFPRTWQPPVTGSRYFPEHRFGLDFKVDLGVGLWMESSVTWQKQNEIPPYTGAMTLGADYTFNIMEGLHVTAEHMFMNSSENLLSSGEKISFSGISLSLPLSIITRVSAIFFYDWKNDGFYRFANLSLTYDKFGINFIGFWNPDNFEIFNYNTGANMFAGYGGQIMIVYNH